MNKKMDKTAVKLTLGQILSAEYVYEEETGLSYLYAAEQQKIFRCNLVATIVGKENQGNIINLFVDDGSGKMAVRFFEDNKTVAKLKVGDIVIVIGRVRIYNQERYLSPDIIKRISSSWLKVRALELKKCQKNDLIREGRETETGLPLREKVKNLIQQLDLGQGALMEDLLQKSPMPDTEKIVLGLLQEGDVYQVGPGRIKIL